tara:strand:+ start:79 stop:360 length:282 start_codon:yes stop_codon:yes gene_type:complete
MRAKKQIENEIMEAYLFLRKENMTIPSETLDFIKDASLNKLNESDKLSELKETYLRRIRSANNIIDETSNDEQKQRLRTKVSVYKYLVIELEQ